MFSRLSRLDDAETLRGLVRDLREGIYVTDREGHVLDANRAFFAMFGVSSLAQLRARTVADLVVDVARRDAELEILHREGAIRDFELDIRRAGGEIRTVIDSATCATDPETGEVFYHGILIDITDRKLLEQRLLDQSLRDPLTGCFNRRFLNTFERRHAEGEHPSLAGAWGCIMVDLDYFKQYNDEFGHEAGDAVLNRVARFLMRQTRAEEAAVRMGGRVPAAPRRGGCRLDGVRGPQAPGDRGPRAHRPVLDGLGRARGRRGAREYDRARRPDASQGAGPHALG